MGEWGFNIFLVDFKVLVYGRFTTIAYNQNQLFAEICLLLVVSAQAYGSKQNDNTFSLDTDPNRRHNSLDAPLAIVIAQPAFDKL